MGAHIPATMRVVYLLTCHVGLTRDISEVSEAEKVDRLSILGAAAIARRARYLEGGWSFR